MTTADPRPRAALVLPGRGAYTSTSLGSLPADHASVDRADALRAELNLPPLRDLDAADTFDPLIHLRPANASPLTWLCSMLDAERARGDHRVVAVLGNSLGWYTALTVGGALDFDDGFRLVQRIALLQEDTAAAAGVGGGQVIYPRIGPDWQPNPDRVAAVSAALASNGEVFPSVDLGSYLVLAGTEAGVQRLMTELPPVRVGERQFPVRLAQHGPYHTPLVADLAQAAAEQLAGLSWRRPSTTLIDGRGRRFTPWGTDPAELAAYTLGAQLVTPYDFAAGVRVALREYAPQVLVLAGPGNTLGGVMGQLIVAESYRGVRSRGAFESVQGSASPLVLAMRD